MKKGYIYIPAMAVYQFMGWPNAPNNYAKYITSVVEREDHHSLKKVIDFVLNHHDKEHITLPFEEPRLGIFSSYANFSEEVK